MTKICIASGTRGQSVNVLEKIQTELRPRSPELCNEIADIKVNTTNAQILFKNGSFIKVVTASDNARGKMVARVIRNGYVELGKKREGFAANPSGRLCLKA